MKKQIKNKLKQISPYFPYPVANRIMHLSNKDYVNWLHDHVFRTHAKTSKYLKEFECLFIHIPKCGGNSIYKGVFKVERDMAHLKAFDYLILLGESEYNSLFKFTFVRNPWDRLVSAYFFLKQGKYSKWFYRNIGNFESFDDFVKKWVTFSNIRRNQVFFPQTEFITIGNEVRVDFIGKCEQMYTDIQYVSDRIGVDFEYRKDNTSKHLNYRELYSKKSRDIVFQVYREDIKKLKYEF